MRNRGALAVGAVLILLGVLVLLNQFIPNAWPLIILAVGLVLMAISVVGRIPGLMISAVVNTALGILFLIQANTGNYASWMFVWPVVPGSVGLGILLTDLMSSPGSWKARLFGAVFALEGAIFTAAGWWLHTQGLLTWPMIILGLGIMFLLSALLPSAYGMAMPGAILAAIGGILLYQNTTGDWASWSYVWALIPGSVGIGLVLISLLGRRRGPWVVGIYFIFWALLFFAIFAAFFAPGWPLLKYWPVLLIVFGLFVLARALWRPGKSTKE